MADLTGDGISDLFTGSFEGVIYLLPGLKKGGFGPAIALRNEKNERLMLGQFWDYKLKRWNNNLGAFKSVIGIGVTSVDWDNDGDLDLILGGYDGRMNLCENRGSAKSPKFSTTTTSIMVNGNPLMVTGAHAIPTVADWDGDGLFDLVSGSGTGGVAWFRNIGAIGKPAFAAEQVIVDRPNSSKLDPRAPGTRTQVHVTDFDGDGDLDLLVGDYGTRPSAANKKRRTHGWVWLYRRESKSE